MIDTLPPKLLSVIYKKIFCVFACVARIMIGKDDKYDFFFLNAYDL